MIVEIIHLQPNRSDRWKLMYARSCPSPYRTRVYFLQLSVVCSWVERFFRSALLPEIETRSTREGREPTRCASVAWGAFWFQFPLRWFILPGRTETTGVWRLNFLKQKWSINTKDVGARRYKEMAMSVIVLKVEVLRFRLLVDHSNKRSHIRWIWSNTVF